MKNSSKSKTKKQEYEELGRIVASVYETGYLDAAKSYKNAFIKGVLGGLGGVLGATILVALLLGFLSFFDEVPLIGRFVQQIQETISQ